jgi:hypothetical protein
MSKKMSYDTAVAINAPSMNITNFSENNVNIGGGSVSPVWQTRDGVYRAPRREIQIYVTFLNNIVTSMYNWTCSKIDETNLRVIENNILFRGYTALIRPIININGRKIRVEKWLPFHIFIQKWNFRTYEPLLINILPQNQNTEFNLNLEQVYDEFIFINSNFNAFNANTPMIANVLDTATKLYELDLTINQVMRKLRLPVFTRVENNNAINNFKAINEGVNNNALHAYINKNHFINDKLPFYQVETKNILPELFELQQTILDNFARSIGISTDIQNNVYVSRDVQFAGLSFTDYKSAVGLKSRKRCLQKCRYYGLDLDVDLTINEMRDSLSKYHSDSPVSEHLQDVNFETNDNISHKTERERKAPHARNSGKLDTNPSRHNKQSYKDRQ